VTQLSPSIARVAGRIERVAPGRQAESALVEAVRRLQETDRLAPVWVVVPSQIVGLSLRRRLVEDGAFAGVRFTPIDALSQQLGGTCLAIGGRRPLSPLALRAAAWVALAEVPGVLHQVADHAATAASLASTYRDLRRLSEADLDRLASTSTRAHDVVALVGRMRTLLETTYYDSTDVLRAAIPRLDAAAASGPDLAEIGPDLAESGPDPAEIGPDLAETGPDLAEIDPDRPEIGPDLAEIGAVVLYLPDPLPTFEITLLASLARHLKVSVLAGRTGDERADQPVNRFVEVLSDVLAADVIDESPASSGAGFHAVGSVLSAPDDDVEVREAVRRLMAHAEAGGDLGRCVVAFPDGELSADLGRRVREQLRGAGVANNGWTSERLRDTPHAQLLIGLVRLALPVARGRELDRGEVMAWLGRGPIRVGHGLTRELPTVAAVGGVPVGAWDRCSRAAGVLSGIDEWRRRLGSYAQVLIGRESAARRLAAAQDLAIFIERLHSLTSGAAAASSWRALHSWADTALAELFEPGDDSEALAHALGDLDALDGLEPLGFLPPAERLRRFTVALEVLFEGPSGDRGKFGVGPTVAPLSAVAGVRSDLLLVLGCREGELPCRPADDPLVPRFEREQIEGLAPPERSDERTRRHLASLLVASDAAQASFARIDVRAGRLAYPSRWTGELFGARATEVPSFAGSVRRVADGTVPAADSTDFELASLVGSASRRPPTWLDRLYPDYSRCRESQSQRRNGGLSPFAGYVPAAAGGPDAWSETFSATSLQSFAECPFRFFLQRKLGVSVLDAPERLVQLEARERGTLMHAVLEGFFRPGTEPWTLTALDDTQLRRLRALVDEQFDRVEAEGKTGKALFWSTERWRIRRDLERYVAADLATLTSGQIVPIAVELEFGWDGPPLGVRAAGRDVLFRGCIDRVDRAPDGLVVIDYKSGRSDSYRNIPTDPLGKGRHLQLPVYAKAALQAFGYAGGGGAPVRAEYRFVQVTGSESVVRVELTDELDRELSAVLGTLASTIDAGCFPLRPGRAFYGSKYEHCRYCDFDALCTTDRAELWQRAGGDSRMKAYSELVSGTGSPGEPLEGGE
jgi:ATP-dependent helicase/nuclease subunit B